MGTDDHAWKNEGSAPIPNVASDSRSLTGTESQVEWAERIKLVVSGEFDRVEKSFRAVAETQDGAKRERTEGILALLEEKRNAVMTQTEAGYFIQDWQDISDQVRQMIVKRPEIPSAELRTQWQGRSGTMSIRRI
jgi:hypothetical protein